MEYTDLTREHIRHIESFSRLITQQGYFEFETGVPVGYIQYLTRVKPLNQVRQKLTDYINAYVSKMKKIPPFNLSAFAHWSGGSSDYLPFVRCKFGIEYTDNGFEVRNIKMSYGNNGIFPEEILRTRELKIDNNGRIPAASHARQMMSKKGQKLYMVITKSIMQRMFEHINGFAELMNRKGYDGHFLSSSGFSDKLKDNLIKHIFQCYEEKREIAQFGLTSYAHWKDDQSPYVKCDFRVDFKEPLGFNVQKINIQYGNEYGPLRNREIPIHNNNEIPDRETATRMMLERKQGIKI